MNKKDKDMYLPVWVCCIGVLFLVAALVCLTFVFTTSANFLIGFVVCFGLGISAILCWKNQWIMMLDDNTFIYSTMFGRQKQHQFLEIRELKQNSDSLTLVLENGKVHIESCAIMSKRFVNAVDSILEKM